jgi:hypothetical protein
MTGREREEALPEGRENGPLARRGVRVPLPEYADEEIPHPSVARMALEVLWREFTNRVPGTLEPEEEAVNKALEAMHSMLWRKEMQAVAGTALIAHYLIIRPVNPLNMPGPEETEEIKAAIAALDRNDLIARGWTDE